jgi:RNA 2',3'-cyclic 3'-phosphodiesterase
MAVEGAATGGAQSPAGAPQAHGWRLFVALELPHDVRISLSSWRDGILTTGAAAGLRPVGRDELHVKLCFLGLCQMESVAAISRACSLIGGSGRALLRIGEALWLPRRRPGVLAVAVEDMDGKLAEAQAALARALIQIGAYRAEARAFLPHVTVARVGRRGTVRSRDLEQPPPVGFEGERVTLYRSVLGAGAGGGSRYDPLHRVDL